MTNVPPPPPPPQPDESTTKSWPTHVIKTREDHEPVGFEGSGDEFQVAEGYKAEWAGASFKQKQLRDRIEPWLTALVQSEHLTLLAGSGLTHAVHFMATNQGAADMSSGPFSNYDEAITKMATKSAEAAMRSTVNLEDKIRTANELLHGFNIVALGPNGVTPEFRAQIDQLETEITNALEGLVASVLQSEKNIALAGNGGPAEEAFNALVSFLMSFASRTGTKDRLNIYTTNYDRILETGAELAGLHLLDRFIGSVFPIFRSSRLDLDMHYNPPGIRGEPRYLEGVARFGKLHGSIDWVQAGRDIRRIGLPFGADDIAPYLQAPGLYGATALHSLIYPNAAKDRETAEFPYVDLFRDFAAASCRPNHVLFTYGYSFGDEHINRTIEDMLTIPSTHLVIMSRSDPQDRIRQLYDRIGRGSQISLLIGPELADLGKLVDHYLPKSAIDRTTFRMAELLKQRMNTQSSNRAEGSGDTDSEQFGVLQ
jgi:hypothetical protein